MAPTTYGFAFALALLLGMPLLLEAGRRFGVRRLKKDPANQREGFGVVEGAVFSLLGLLIAFTFAGAARRFDDRRHMIVEEANCVGTAYLRIDLLPAARQPAMRELFRKYLDARLDAYRSLPDMAKSDAARARASALQGEIWAAGVAACRESGSQPAHVLFLPAVNEMFDIATTRVEATKIHPPVIIFAMLGLLTLAASLLAGHGMAGNRVRSLTHIGVFAAVVSTTVFVIVDIEHPRFGFIRVNGSDKVLEDLREGMK